MSHVLFRAKSGPHVGEGHLVRSRAVAEEVVALGGQAAFVVDERASAERLAAEGFDARAALDVPDWAALPCDAAWVDGFADWSDDLRVLRRRGVTTLLVENRTPAREWCDLLVYPALHHVPDPWDRVHGERVLAGAPWVPLRRAMRRAVPALQRDVDLLVTFGGLDPRGLTERVLALLPAAARRVVVAVGVHMEPRRAQLAALAAAARGREVTLLPTGTDLAPWMARSRAAITALGTTLYELAHLQARALILANHEHDRDPLAYYAEHGPHVPLGLATELSDGELETALASSLGKLHADVTTEFPDLADGARRLARRLVEARGRASA